LGASARSGAQRLPRVFALARIEAFVCRCELEPPLFGQLFEGFDGLAGQEQGFAASFNPFGGQPTFLDDVAEVARQSLDVGPIRQARVDVQLAGGIHSAQRVELIRSLPLKATLAIAQFLVVPHRICQYLAAQVALVALQLQH
jgi:hypothetical protein